MDHFSSFFHIDALANNKEAMTNACFLIQNTPLRKDPHVALCILQIDPSKIDVFDKCILHNLEVAKLIVRHLNVHVDRLPDPILRNAEFIDFVFKEAPYYAHYLPFGAALTKAFTPALLEHVMAKVRTKIYSHKVLKRIPRKVRRPYASTKIKERTSFHILLFEDRKNVVARLPVELKQHTAVFLGLVTSAQWLTVLTLIHRRIY